MVHAPTKKKLKETEKIWAFPRTHCWEFCTDDFIMLSTGKIRVNILFITFPKLPLYLRHLPFTQNISLSF